MSARLVFGPLTLRPLQGRWWALGDRGKGWRAWGYPFAYLGEALDAFNAKAVGFGVDEAGLYITAVAKEEDGHG